MPSSAKIKQEIPPLRPTINHSMPPDSLVVYEEKQLVIRNKSARKTAGSAPDWSI